MGKSKKAQNKKKTNNNKIKTNNMYEYLSTKSDSCEEKEEKTEEKSEEKTGSGSDRGLPPPYTIQFGKFKGELIVDVWNKDPRYCNWLIDNINPEDSKHKTFVINSLTYYKENPIDVN